MATTDQPEFDPQAARKALRRGALLTSGAGIGFGTLSLVAWLLLIDARAVLESEADPREAYDGTVGLGAEIAGLYLLPFAAILFLWFIVALRAWIRGTQHRRNLLISDVQFVSGAVFTALFLVGAGALASSVVVGQSAEGALEAESLRVLVGFGNTLMTVMGVRIAAIFVIATASLGLSTGSLPRWFNFASYLFAALLMLTPVVDQILVLAFPSWVMLLSVLLLFHLKQLADDELPGFAARYADTDPAD